MRNTAPGVDRILMTELRTTAATIKNRMHNHIPHCEKCSSASGDVYAHCNIWWRDARILHKLRRKLNALERPPEYDQMPLPGMERP